MGVMSLYGSKESKSLESVFTQMDIEKFMRVKCVEREDVAYSATNKFLLEDVLPSGWNDDNTEIAYVYDNDGGHSYLREFIDNEDGTYDLKLSQVSGTPATEGELRSFKVLLKRKMFYSIEGNTGSSIDAESSATFNITPHVHYDPNTEDVIFLRIEQYIQNPSSTGFTWFEQNSINPVESTAIGARNTYPRVEVLGNEDTSDETYWLNLFNQFDYSGIINYRIIYAVIPKVFTLTYA